MSDAPTKTGQDRRFISLEQDYEVRDWTQSVKCSEEELHAAVKAVGNSADDVRAHLQGRRK
ncbi:MULTISPECIES: DUF3606 domain-containing protein [unclassified Acidovorax]|uniref:DUF3606 domain-containing protein n=1 Tax=unclassified Acidovorax TaxID=2684926 RepID=UPI002882FD49|nr:MULTISPECIES: DUF3606 domain-containing protein [unclassified Acidovorax]